MSDHIEDRPDTITPGEWATVAEQALGVMKVAADVAAKKAADEIYGRILDSAQDYLTENLRFNIASTLATAERERKAAQERVGGLLAIIGDLQDALWGVLRATDFDDAEPWIVQAHAALARAQARQ